MNEKYSMLIEWSGEDGVFVASLPEWGPYARTHGATYEDAARAGREVLEMLIENRRAEGRPLPEPRLLAGV
jgi:predicted RNase H-like HicB family nuclease